MYKRKRLGPFRTVAIRNSEVGRYSGGVNVQYEWQKKSVPEVASAIWSESAIGEVRYRRFHCSTKCMYSVVDMKRIKRSQQVEVWNFKKKVSTKNVNQCCGLVC